MPRYDDYDRDDDDDDDFDDVRRRPRRDRAVPPKQSGMGVTSTCMAAVVFLGYLATIVAAVIIQMKNNNVPMRDDDPLAVLLGLGILGSGALNLAGLVIGIVALAQSDRYKVWAIIGTLFHLILLLGILGLICIGILMG